MPKNYLIGIGGTGARVIEAVVFMCAAGYGPSELSIFLVDPDKGNGNFRRTKELIENYTFCKKNFQPVDDSVDLFKTDIKIPDPIVWNIFGDEKENQDTTLAGYIVYQGLQKNLADFASILFSEDEMNTQLNKGFRGHPSIGAVVMANMEESKYPLKMLFDGMQNAGQNEIRLFLAGSIFGGTGAAGVPTFGSKNVIKYHKDADLGDRKSKVLMGGALVLPYFSFDIDQNTNEKMFVTPNDFPMATKAALDYYGGKKEELGFDQIYFIGDNASQNVGTFSTGSDDQENLPHYIEIVTGLAAYDFFEQPPIDDIPVKQYFVAGRPDETVSWDTLPFDRESNSDSKSVKRDKKFKSDFVSMSVFSYALCAYVYRNDKKGVLDIEQNPPWFANNFPKTNRSDDNKQILKKYHEFSTRFLSWICALNVESNRVELVDNSKIISDKIAVGQGINFFDDNKTGGLHERYIGDIVKGVKEPLPFSTFMSRLNEINLSKANISPASKVINALYKGSKQFAVKNYGL